MSDFRTPNPSLDKGFHKPTRRPCGSLFSANLTFGLLFIIAGSALLLDRLGYLDAGQIFYYWPLALVIFGVGLLVQRRRQAVVSGGLLLVVGSVLLLQRVGLLSLGLRELWPVVLIVIGVVVLFNSFRSRSPEPAGSPSGNPDVLNDGAFFGGVEKKVDSHNFRGGEAFAIFGGVDVDLSRARLARDVQPVLTANAVFGGVEMRVPQDWRVVMEGVAILGGFADSRKFIDDRLDDATDSRPTLIVRGIALFGGVEIKN
ncbi:MAG: cell wall-active antibiotics response protein [Bryobacterales bacterium]|jgi:predicted membrane protein|nr:cell wall-active antibiotics response protein [Bryobacterales bacterium]